MENKLITGIIGVVVVVALLGSALVPVIDGLTEGEKTTNEGAGWVRMDYVTGAAYDVNVSFDDQGNVRIDTGVPGSGIQDTQTHAADEDTILFASSEISMWLQDGVINILGKDSNGSTIFEQITETGDIATVLNDGTGAQYKHGTEVGTPISASAWAYVPKSSGNFGFFDAGTPVDMNNYPVAAAGGGFAGVLTYNGMTNYSGVPVQIQKEFDDDGKLIGATWTKLAAAEDLNVIPFDPSTITIQPLDPGVISLDPEPDAAIMSVPTPTYTDGDWGYDLKNVGGVSKAVIVSYSGTGGDVVVPATVGGYDVYQFGKGEVSTTVFESTLSITSLKLSDGIEEIGQYAMIACTGFTGTIEFPSTLKNIGAGAFRATKMTGSILLPEGVTTIANNAFYQVSTLRGTLVIPESVTTIENNAFSGTAFDKVIIASDAIPGTNALEFSLYSGRYIDLLDLSEVDYQKGSYGIPNNDRVTISDTLEGCIGYVSFVEIGSDAPLSGSAATLLVVIPAVLVATLLIAAVGWFVYNRY